MKRTEAACPACGAPVEFRVASSLVAVCGQCGSLTARGDRKLEDQGKVAALVETNSPLALGVTGSFNGKSFELVGRAQYRHASGAVWDEWYAAFSNGRWGWLAEAQGRFFLTFVRELAPDSRLFAHQQLHPGMSVDLGPEGTYTVADLGPSNRIAAAGELPYIPHLGAAHAFADLAGPDGHFATLDYDGPTPQLFVGRQVTLADLSISPVVDASDRVREIAAILLDCPNCGGSLEMHAPDQVERVACPYCRGLLDVDQGQLRYLKTLDAGLVRPLIPLGRIGTLHGTSYTVIGFLQRAVTIEQSDYYWTEYLLYGADSTFRWLVNSDGHWSFVEPVSPGDVRTTVTGASYRGQEFRLFQRAVARVTYVLGEFTWKIEVGELVETNDYVAPPLALSIEITNGGAAADATVPQQDERVASGASEINMSLATYVPHLELEQAFQLKHLPRGWTVAANQPNPVDRRVYWMWVAYVAALIVLDLLINLIRGAERVDDSWLVVGVILVSIVPIGSFLFANGFEKSRWNESSFSPYGDS